MLEDFWQIGLHLRVALERLWFRETLAQSVQGFIYNLLQQHRSQYVVCNAAGLRLKN